MKRRKAFLCFDLFDSTGVKKVISWRWVLAAGGFLLEAENCFCLATVIALLCELLSYNFY